MIDLSTIEGFDWDAGNKEKNWRLHKVAWTEAEEAFLNEPLLLLPDPKHSQLENRFALLGRSLADRQLAIVFTVRNNRVRVISARDMSWKERRFYDETTKENR